MPLHKLKLINRGSISCLPLLGQTHTIRLAQGATIKSMSNSNTESRFTEAANTVFDQHVSKTTNRTFLGFAIDLRPWHYFIGPLAVSFFMKTYLLFAVDDKLILISIRKGSNYRLKYLDHSALDSRDIENIQYKEGFLYKKLHIRTQQRSYKLKFAKRLSFNQPAAAAKILGE